MSKCCVCVLLAGAVFLAGLTLTRQSVGQDEPPVRLKKKKPRGDEKPKTEPAKPDDNKKDEKKDDQKTEPREPEPIAPQEEEKEVLQRVVKNVHNVEERLAKNDLGEGTRQTQRDILKDIESLIHRSENPPPQSGGQQDQNNSDDDQNANENKDQQSGGGQSQGQRSKSNRKSQGNSSGQKPQGSRAGQKSQEQRNGGRKTSTKPGDGSKPGGEKPAGKDGDGKEPGGKNGKNGNGGGGGDKDDRAPNKSADVYKDEWGHLPATLRPQMDAYSNSQSFLPKYDDLIKRYYRTIAEQGRRKGD